MTFPSNHRTFSLTVLLFIILFTTIINSCEPLATGFDDTEEAQSIAVDNYSPPPDTFHSIRIMTWNIRFCARRLPWFGDACGSKVILTEEEVMDGLKGIVGYINATRPDILLLQEVDMSSRRTDFIDELQYILDNTYFGYAVYGSQWETQFIPSDGLGRLHEVNAILSRWKISDAKRIQLALRGDQDRKTRYFYERCCMVKGRIEIPGVQNLYALNIHASAFATDDTKQKHIERFKEELDKIMMQGNWFIAGGDLNTLPPGSDSTDYCMEDMCPGESFHNPADNPLHKEGSNYKPEQDWLIGLYNDYQSAVPSDEYLEHQSMFFTHTTRPDHFWDRTLDYLFTNYHWIENSGMAHQDALYESDHAPVSGILILPVYAEK
jgi:endonuclease/exonuclease/phosphatase family metal-dependent hydrolase